MLFKTGWSTSIFRVLSTDLSCKTECDRDIRIGKLHDLFVRLHRLIQYQMQKKSIRIVAISDTHNRQIPLPKGDILIHAGDFSNCGTADEVKKFCQYLDQQEFEHKVVIAGNHELGLDPEYNKNNKNISLKQVEELRQLMKAHCHYLQHSVLQVEGIRIFGSPHTPDFFNWAFMYNPKDAKPYWEINESVDILVTHGPPFGILDRVNNNCVGCPELLEAVFKIKPRYHLFGHIHPAYGHHQLEDIHFYNCSIVNDRLKVVNQPHVFDYVHPLGGVRRYGIELSVKIVYNCYRKFWKLLHNGVKAPTSYQQYSSPGEFLKQFDQRRESGGSFAFPSTSIQQPTVFKTSIVGNISTQSDEFYKSQVIERGIGGEPVYLNAINHYKPLSGADDPQIMDQIRQEHIKIMDNKLQEAIAINGGNAVQQVKTVIIEPIAEVVELAVSTVQDGYPGTGRKSSIINTTGIITNPSGRASTLTMSPLPSPRVQKRASQVQGHSRVEYVPFQRKVTELQTREIVQRVPVERRVIEYEDRVRLEQVPVEKTMVDYYAVEHITEYQPQVFEEKVIQMVPIQKTIQKTNYVPIEKKIVHYPEGQAMRGSIIAYQQPPSIERVTSQRKSIINYQAPSTARSNSLMAQQNSGLVSPRGRLTRNSSQIMNLGSITSIANNIGGPIGSTRHQNRDISSKGFQYTRVVEQPVTIVHNAHILPFTSQLQQMRVIQPPSQHMKYPQSTVYPPPSQVQTIYQIPNQPIAPISRQMNPTFAKPQEVVYQNKVLRRQGSGISLTR